MITICIILVSGLVIGEVFFIQLQNRLSSLEALKTEIETPNVSMLSYSWEDSPYLYSTTQNLLRFNCTLFNTGFQTARDVHVTLTVYYVNYANDSSRFGGIDIPTRQTVMLTGMSFVHNNTAIHYITIEMDWVGGTSGNIVNTYS